MTGRASRSPWALGTVAAAVVLVPLLVRQELRSMERGNRLYRGGDAVAAAGVYGRAIGRSVESDEAYNLGTALLGFEGDSAQPLLERAAAAEDLHTAQRGSYNLGYRHLVRTEAPVTPDTMQAALEAAIASFRTALRLDPTDQDARWNLALAVRRRDALLPPGEETGEEGGSESDDEVPTEDAQLARSDEAPAESGPEPEDPRPTDDSGQRIGPREGAREAWAMQDPGPLTTQRALDLLATVSDSPEDLMKGILWSHRPDIAWWSGQPYPGGAW